MLRPTSISTKAKRNLQSVRMHKNTKKSRRAKKQANLHNAFRAPVESDDLDIFPQLAHFLVDFDCDIDIGIHGVFLKVGLDAVL